MTLVWSGGEMVTRNTKCTAKCYPTPVANTCQSQATVSRLRQRKSMESEVERQRVIRYSGTGSGLRGGNRVASRPATESGEHREPQTAGAFSGGGRRPQPAPAGSVAGRATQRDQRGVQPAANRPSGERHGPFRDGGACSGTKPEGWPQPA